jgi:D-erythrulose 4-phosphate isomerase
MRIAIGGDRIGASLVPVIEGHLAGRPGVVCTNLTARGDGAEETYAETAERIALRVRAGEFDRAILVCGTGIGVCISANKVPGIRAALAHDTYSAERASLSNNAQIITMGARVIGPELAKSIVDAWLRTQFDPAGASAANVAAILALDRKYQRPPPGSNPSSL